MCDNEGNNKPTHKPNDDPNNVNGDWSQAMNNAANMYASCMDLGIQV
jgi:hypothetical protein